MVNNLTEGKPLKLLFFFAIPMVVGNLFQQLYNMVDSMVVGRFVGEDALAAVGSSFPVVFLSVAIAAGLSMGCTVVISQFFGAGKILEMKITVSTALISLGVIGLIIMGIGEITTVQPMDSPAAMATDKKTTGKDEPTAARASSPTKRPTTMESTML